MINIQVFIMIKKRFQSCVFEITCKCLCIVQAAIFPSAAASTAVSAVPARSPPQNTPGILVAIVSGSIFGEDPHESNSSPFMADFTSSDAKVDPKAEMIKSHR